jgi:hypothetical protein
MGPETGANVEYWFRLLYECVFLTCRAGFDPFAYLATIWLWIIWIGYILTIIGLFFIIYCLVRIYELREQEEHQLEHLIAMPEMDAGTPRWVHIRSLMDSNNPNDWRQAIIEADILLEDILTRQGYDGAGVGEKLKQVEASDMDTLQDAWEAHKVRNQIAHEGSAFVLSETLARRTISRYETVFRESQLI